MAIQSPIGSGISLGEFLVTLLDAVNRSMELNGDEFIHVDDYDGGKSLTLNPAIAELLGGSLDGIQKWVVVEIMKIEAVDTSEDDDDNPTQWTYKGQIVRPSTETLGYGDGSTRFTSNGGTGGWVRLCECTKEDDWVNVYNFREYKNDGAGMQGNGVNHDGSSYPENVKMTDLMVGELYPAMEVTKWKTDDEGNRRRIIEYWVNSPNGEDGTCT